MTDPVDSEPGSVAGAGGLLDSLRRMLGTLLALASTRLELLTTELEEEMHRLARLLLWALATLFCVTLAVLMGAVSLLIVFWHPHRVAVAGSLTAMFTVAALLAWRCLRQQLAERPALLSATSAELARDTAILRGDG